MLDLKTNKCCMKHVDTRYHWIKQFVDDDIVNVKYIKSEVNVSDICTKKLPAKLFEKHSNKPVSDVGFFTRCNTKLNGKAGTWRDTDWAREVRLRMLAEPMGEIQKHFHMNYTVTKWIPDYRRLRCLKKEVQGPLQKSCIRRRYDCTGSLIYP